MKFTWMRRLDFYAGFLPCHILALYHRIRGRNQRKALPENINRVLLVKFLGFGSILMTTPLMAELKKNYPQAEIHFLTFSDNFSLCESISLMDRVFCVEKKSLPRFAVSLVKTLYQLRRQDYDLLFNLEFFSNFSLLVSSLARPRTAFCFGGRHEYRKVLCQRIISYENQAHIVEKFCNFLKFLDVRFSPDTKNLVGLEEDADARSSVLALLAELEVMPERDFLVVVNINAGEMSSIRKWPLEYYQQVISFLLQKERVKIILIGGKEDVNYVSSLAGMFPSQENKIINLAGRMSLKELISLMKASRLYLGNDSGPLHLAEACGLPNVGFFGPESPRIYGHSGRRNHTFYLNLPCSPCLNVYTNKDTRCTDNICLKWIKPQQVIKVLEEKYFSK
ncbi:MAG: glycosyltransferase family 9 protein [Candidatus Aminicenantes bacterium]